MRGKAHSPPALNAGKGVEGGDFSSPCPVLPDATMSFGVGRGCRTRPAEGAGASGCVDLCTGGWPCWFCDDGEDRVTA